MTSTALARMKSFVAADARRLGFCATGIADAAGSPLAGERLAEFVANGRHGTMGWMPETLDRRRSPRDLWPNVRSIVVLAMNYGPDEDPLAILDRPDRGAISVYARHRDYHDVIKGRLKELAGRLVARAREAGFGDHDAKVFVDTAPVMEKPLGERAGLGWQGKHTNLLSRDFGSWLFLGSIFTTLELEPDEAGRDRCGSCRACLDACPTNAFPAPYQLDARRCISYLTIETKAAIPRKFRAAMGNRIYGCDDCLAVCPWNKFAERAREAKLVARDDLKAPRLDALLGLDDADFRALFSGSPIKRIGRDKFVSNCLIAAGNSGEPALLPQVEGLLADAAAPVRAMAVWALGRLDHGRALRLRPPALDIERDETVRSEWHVLEESEV
ncbi:tRNA epoxyqueuosine(34) reductase QueG [Jiella sonneratiae]|uniref:Epoxyqueuosine reductase n=1 Tax=Jiella sonneratiae TaxID=2816856 RepID=A0ABS3J2T7_9HYPH|nr:tRNA epoxyqueuosine(34) reductase QueG [Jiella sonneratiae]MBO0903974.1 tRNA epoxyqueuosine(34) reductase QueG [Jiella sonneratiae]